jgi:hypothetical protein
MVRLLTNNSNLSVLSDDDFTMISALIQKRILNGVQANGIFDRALTPSSPPELSMVTTPEENFEKDKLAKRRAIVEGRYVPRQYDTPNGDIELTIPTVMTRSASTPGRNSAPPSPTSNIVFGASNVATKVGKISPRKLSVLPKK